MPEPTNSPEAGVLCPHCRVDLVMSDRQGVEIDYCPKCRGVWLDRGELDKILERSVTVAAPTPQRAAQPPAYGKEFRDDHGGSSHDSGQGGRRRKSWLSEIFD